jgi:hypothetical protein
MPAPRVLDLTTRKAEPTGTDEFFADVRSYYKNKEDSDIIGGILGEYEKAEDKSKGIQKAIFDTERNNQLSPSRKLAAMKTLRDQQDITLEEKKLAGTQAKALLEADEKRKKAEETSRKEDEKTNKENVARDNLYQSNKSLLMDAGYPEEEAERYARVDSATTSAARARQRQKENAVTTKENKKLGEEDKAQKVTQKAFDNIAALVPKVGRSGIITSKLGGETAGAYSEFTSLTGALEALLVDKVSRGTLSNARFKYITETLLPKPSDSQEDIKGKLKGVATILELDPSSLGLKKSDQKEDPHAGMVQIRDPQGILRWVPEKVAQQLKG